MVLEQCGMGVCHQYCYQEEDLVLILWHEGDVFVSFLVTDIPLSIWQLLDMVSHQKCGFGGEGLFG